MNPALFFEKAEDKRVVCHLCPHDCRIAPGKKGVCRVRENEQGDLYSLNYGKVASWGLDPIEKKPLYNFHPGSLIFSAGTVGCNFHCEFCQNWEIAQGEPPLSDVSARQLVRVSAAEERSVGIAYTYSEPLMWYEFVRECSQLAQEKGLKNVLVTNGFINEEPLKELLPYVDAFNIDVKGFTNDFYRRVVKGRYEPVLDTVKAAHDYGCHVELTTLLIPGLNDSEQEIEELTDWVAAELSTDVPLHFSRYYPSYKMKLASTPVETLERAYEIASRKLNYVYLGNINLPGKADTYCPACKERVVKRSGFGVDITGLDGNKCSFCGAELAIISGY